MGLPLLVEGHLLLVMRDPRLQLRQDLRHRSDVLSSSPWKTTAVKALLSCTRHRDILRRRKTTGEGRQRGRGRIASYRDSSMSKRVEPVPPCSEPPPEQPERAAPIPHLERASSTAVSRMKRRPSPLVLSNRVRCLPSTVWEKRGKLAQRLHSRSGPVTSDRTRQGVALWRFTSGSCCSTVACSS